MASVTVENYLKTIFQEQQQHADKVAMGQLAEAMDIAPGTATAMVKTLSEANLVDYAPRSGVALTAQGEKLALQVIRRHRLIELFLVEVLNMDWAKVHDEAEELEHSISEKVLEKIDEFLGHPVTDPHGDPIPPAKGALRQSQRDIYSLAECNINKKMIIERIVDQSSEFLQFANDSGLIPSKTVVVTSRQSAADSVIIKFKKSKKTITIGTTAATKILVRPADK